MLTREQRHAIKMRFNNYGSRVVIKTRGFQYTVVDFATSETIMNPIEVALFLKSINNPIRRFQESNG